VNGFHHNPRYVSGAVQTTRDYMASKVNPVLVSVLSEVARCKPADPRAFIVDVLKSGETPPPEAAKGGEAGYEEALASIQAELGELVKRLMVDQPEDVAGYVVQQLQGKK